MQYFMVMKTLEPLHNRDKKFPYFILLKPFAALGLFIDFPQQVAFVGILHNSTIINYINTITI